MKKQFIIATAIFIVLSFSLISQTVLPGPIAINNTGGLLKASDRMQEHILCGSWWGHDLRVSNNMRMNMVASSVGGNHGPGVFYRELCNVQHNDNIDFDITNNKTKVQLLPSFAAFPFLSVSFQYEPRLQITDESIKNFEGIGDAENSIWGFRNINVNSPNDDTKDEIQNGDTTTFLVLDKTNDAGNTVLKDVWPNNWMTRFQTVKRQN